ncbi:hypothetical protein ASPSYDRAFT_39878 [Aspergillus sydowii CBS 593.65]|uniref:SMP-30/Gluconolactonase/LRE-like region domain-containing protein n=1 Tax=Aspergillus sydowii CBS 593.65 TaxID=1036612 RepID=A0A1L9U086_9EURO|nr:uncharacterized protein ASPSYDRAFT_39878 [Aspergillus sydowii CBS 593.65]OJJ65079.1 hypothetical protein ASPSYDRAFT_39878 [Aspergillus sydowii CBS 593.65]
MISRFAQASTLFLLGHCALFTPVSSAGIEGLPPQAQFIDQRTFNVLNSTLPPAQFNATSTFIPPGTTEDSLAKRPFHVYDKEFLKIIGRNPTLTLIAQTEKDPIFHEAVVWSKSTDEVFFVQNAGAKDAGTGLHKSAIIQKVSLAQAAAVSNRTNAVGLVNVTTVHPSQLIANPNGGTNYGGGILFVAEGQGDKVAPGIFLMNPKKPYTTRPLLNNFFGRQFNSLNDVNIHPENKDIYFTDTIYGYVQDFRPAPGLPNQIYRFNPDTGAVTIAADGFVHSNGFTFSPDGKRAYVTDTGISYGFYGYNLTDPASIYQFDVFDDGTLGNRKTFAFVHAGVPDGIHCDTQGNVYTGTGDGVHVFNPSGKLIGKIYLGTTSANFNFAGNGRMVIAAETELYYATLAAEGGFVESEM